MESTGGQPGRVQYCVYPPGVPAMYVVCTHTHCNGITMTSYHNEKLP